MELKLALRRATTAKTLAMSGPIARNPLQVPVQWWPPA
jgi:hypothetical protein